MAKKKAATKQRAKKYEPKLHIDLSFKKAMKVIITGEAPTKKAKKP